MNRKERRKAGNRAPVRSYTLNSDQIEAIKSEAVAEATWRATVLMFGIPCLVLHDHYGYSKEDLDLFIDKCTEWYKSIEEGDGGFEDLIEALEEEIGLKIIDQMHDGR